LTEASKKKPAFAPVGGVLGQQLEQWGLAERINLKRVQQLWPKVVGEKIAGFTQVVGLAGNRLKIKLDRTDWLSALQPLQEEIILKLNQGLGSRVVEEIILEAKTPPKVPKRRA
jgi:predicted nucleic acid-binding Zn ribbon protein